MQFTLIETISIIAAFQSFLLAIYFISIKGLKRQSNVLLSSILTIFIVLIISSLFLTRGVSSQYLKFVIICNQFSLLIAPMLYLYIKTSNGNPYQLKTKDLLHAIPFLIVISYFIYNFYVIDHFIFWRSMVRIFGSAIFLIQSSLYLILSIRTLKDSRNKVAGNMASGQSWLQTVVTGFVVVWLINMHLFIVLDLWHNYGMCPYLYSVYFLTLFVIFNLLILLALKKSKLFLEMKKYQNSSLSEKDKDQYRKQLLSYMETEKPYRNPNLTISDLSKNIRITMCYLSLVINESFNQNFRDFINFYRIEESKSRLVQNDMNILNIAYEVGFNSKSAFNTAFKKFTGMTPKEYRKRNIPVQK